MKNKNKVIILVSIITGILVLTLGLTYAVLTFDETKGNSQLVLGDIWMKYEESNGISLEGVMPGSAYSNYFEFTITGTNTYEKKDIYYDISLVKGDLIDGKTEANRIEDKYLQFKLVEVVDNVEAEIFVDQTYEYLTDKRIHVETIPKNAANYTKTYRLYMTLSNELIIGNTSDAILSLEEFSDAFASVKVNVTGDFNEKEIEKNLEPTDAACFAYTENEDGTLTLTEYYLFGESLKDKRPEGMTYKKEGENLTTAEYNLNFENNKKIIETDTKDLSILCTRDVVIPSTIDGKSVTIIDYDFYNPCYDEDLRKQGYYLTSVVIPDSVTEIRRSAFKKNYLTNITFSKNLITIGDYAFRDNNLTSVVIPNSVTTIEDSAFENNSLTSVEIPNSVTEIGSSAFRDNNLTSVVIPDSVTEIGSSAFSDNDLTSIDIPETVVSLGMRAFNNNKVVEGELFIYNRTDTNRDGIAEIDRTSLNSYVGSSKDVVIPEGIIIIPSYLFSGFGLTSIVLPNSLKTIEYSAFENNLLTSIVLPNSLKTIESFAFNNNLLTSIDFPNGLETIKFESFTNNNLTNVDIPTSVQSLDCYVFDEGVVINKSDDLVCRDNGE